MFAWTNDMFGQEIMFLFVFYKSNNILDVKCTVQWIACDELNPEIVC